MRTIAVLVTLLLAFATPCFAQETAVQLKTVVRPTIELTKEIYIASWNITNLRQNASDNTNFMLGLGRKGKNWWFEAMLQRQYSLSSNQWFLDFRYQAVLPGGYKLFVEAAPFLERKALFHFIRLDRKVGRVYLGAESENIFRENNDSLGIGPMVTFPAVNLKAVKINPTLAYQFRFRREPGFVRFYLAIPMPFN